MDFLLTATQICALLVTMWGAILYFLSVWKIGKLYKLRGTCRKADIAQTILFLIIGSITLSWLVNYQQFMQDYAGHILAFSSAVFFTFAYMTERLLKDLKRIRQLS